MPMLKFVNNWIIKSYDNFIFWLKNFWFFSKNRAFTYKSTPMFIEKLKMADKKWLLFTAKQCNEILKCKENTNMNYFYSRWMYKGSFDRWTWIWYLKLNTQVFPRLLIMTLKSVIENSKWRSNMAVEFSKILRIRLNLITQGFSVSLITN